MAVQLDSSTGVKPHPVTLEEYERMCQAGVFEPEARIELICGIIVDMEPIEQVHMSTVARLNHKLQQLVGDDVLVWPQGNSARLPQSQSRPQPDTTLLRWRDDYYRRKWPVPEDVLLLIEVAKGSLKYDRGLKRALYAEAGIVEYWVVNLVDGVIEVYTDPAEGKYQSARRMRRGQALPLPGGMGSIAVADVLG